MRVIFLDFDGVLNTYSYMFLTDGDAPELGLDPKRVAYVNEIIQRTGAVVVLSTAWRYDNTQFALECMLRKRGLVGEVVGMTPEPEEHVTYKPREVEVQAWLDKHPEVESFVVLDDLDGQFNSMKDRFVNTDPSRGLTPEHVEAAVKILTVSLKESAA